MIAELHALRRAGKADELRGAMQLLGINPVVRAPVELDATAKSLIEARTAARANKDWKESDRIRDELAAMGVVLKDGKDADGKPVTTWELAR
jgi:cysteinyl-tRNA synthetase